MFAVRAYLVCIAASALIVTNFGFASSTSAKKISIALLMSTGSERLAFKKITDSFYKKTGISVKVIAKSDAAYKKVLDKWVVEGKSTPDVLYWQAGKRLFHYAKQGKIIPINDLWTRLRLDDSFSPGLKELVTLDGQVYGLPYAYYNWGFYYKKSLFRKLDIAEPQTFADLKAMAKVLKDNGVVPFASGIQNNWPATAWFDYMNLRLNGIDFSVQLAAGKVPYTDPRVVAVFKEWKSLIDLGYFKKGQKKKDWSGYLGDLYRDQVGTQLIGNFVIDKLDKRFKNDIGFFPFPKMKKEIPLFELAPTEVFMIPKAGKNHQHAMALIEHFSLPESQTAIASDMYIFPANNKSVQVGIHSLAAEGETYLKKAPAYIQYFDRDNEPEFEKLAVPAIANFMVDADLKKVVADLEKFRNQVYN